MQILQDLLAATKESNDLNLEVAFNIFTIAHLRAMSFVLGDCLASTTMIIYEHQFLTEVKKEIEKTPIEYQSLFKKCFEKDMQRILDKNIVSTIND